MGVGWLIINRYGDQYITLRIFFKIMIIQYTINLLNVVYAMTLLLMRLDIAFIDELPVFIWALSQCKMLKSSIFELEEVFGPFWTCLYTLSRDAVYFPFVESVYFSSVPWMVAQWSYNHRHSSSLDHTQLRFLIFLYGIS